MQSKREAMLPKLKLKTMVKKGQSADAPKYGRASVEAVKTMKTSFDDKRQEMSFFVKKGQSRQICIANPEPWVIPIHGTVRITKDGKKFYPTEVCQKVSEKSCLWCDSTKSTDSVKPQKNGIFYEVTEIETEKPFFFEVNSFVLNELLAVIEDYGADATSIILEISKNDDGNTKVEIAKTREGSGKSATYKDKYWEGEHPEFPDFMEIWSPKSDEEIIKILSWVEKDGEEETEEE